jgi:hypothetical protein
MLGRAGLPLAGSRRGGALGAAGKAQPVDLADHGVPRHVPEFRGDLAGGKSAFPELFQLFDAIVRPGQYRHRTLSLAWRRPILGQRCGVNRLKNPCWQNPLALAGREKRARTFTPNNRN